MSILYGQDPSTTSVANLLGGSLISLTSADEGSTLLTGKSYSADTSAGDLNIILPAATGAAGSQILIKHEDAGANLTSLLNYTPQGGETIDGLSSGSLELSNTRIFISDGTNWTTLLFSNDSLGKIVEVLRDDKYVSLIDDYGFQVTKDGVIVVGDVDTDGSWRIRSENNFLQFDRASIGSWDLAVHTIGSSTIDDGFVLNSQTGAITFIAPNSERKLLLKPSLDGSGTLLGNAEGRLGLFSNGDFTYSSPFEAVPVWEEKEPRSGTFGTPTTNFISTDTTIEIDRLSYGITLWSDAPADKIRVSVVDPTSGEVLVHTSTENLYDLDDTTDSVIVGMNQYLWTVPQPFLRDTPYYIRIQTSSAVGWELSDNIATLPAYDIRKQFVQTRTIVSELKWQEDTAFTQGSIIQIDNKQAAFDMAFTGGWLATTDFTSSTDFNTDIAAGYMKKIDYYPGAYLDNDAEGWNLDWGDIGIDNPAPTEKLDVTGVVKSKGFVGSTTSGVVGTMPTYNDNGDGTISLGQFDVALYKDTEFHDGVRDYTIASSGPHALTDNDTNYITVAYLEDGGGDPIPAVQVVTDLSTITMADITPLYAIYRSGNALHKEDWLSGANGLAERLNKRAVLTGRFKREYDGGLTLNTYGTKNVSISAGSVWFGATQISTDLFQSTVTNIKQYYHSTGSWVSSSVSVYNNTQYDDGTDLVSLTTDYFVVNWVFKGMEDGAGSAYIVLSGEYETSGDAQSASLPENLPDEIIEHSLLVGRMIVQEGEISSEIIESAFDTVYPWVGSSGGGGVIYTQTEKDKLASLTGGRYLGVYADLTALQTAHPTGVDGDHATVTDPTSNMYYWNGSAWADSGTGSEGDMLQAVYDPTSVSGDAFDMDNMVESATAKVLTNTERSKLSGIEANAEVNNISDANATDLTDAGESSLHYHSSDRDRANHTGTQLASTISDFDTAVSANSDVAANTGDLTLGGVAYDTTDDTLDLSGQVLTVNQVTTTSDGAMIAGDKLKFDNISGNGAGDDWISGLDVTEASPKDQSVDYTSGTYLINGTLYSIASGGNLDLTSYYTGIGNSQHAYVVLYVDIDQVLEVVVGSFVDKFLVPPLPSLPVDSVCISIIEIKASSVGNPKNISNKEIHDCRNTPAISTDEFVTVSAEDTTTGHLDDKLSNNGDISFTIENPAGNETLKADIQSTAISGKSLVTGVSGQEVLVNDSGTLKKVDVVDFLGGGGSVTFTEAMTDLGTSNSAGWVSKSTSQVNKKIDVLMINSDTGNKTVGVREVGSGIERSISLPKNTTLTFPVMTDGSGDIEIKSDSSTSVSFTMIGIYSGIS